MRSTFEWIGLQFNISYSNYYETHTKREGERELWLDFTGKIWENPSRHCSAVQLDNLGPPSSENEQQTTLCNTIVNFPGWEHANEFFISHNIAHPDDRRRMRTADGDVHYNYDESGVCFTRSLWWYSFHLGRFFFYGNFPFCFFLFYANHLPSLASAILFYILLCSAIVTTYSFNAGASRALWAQWKKKSARSSGAIRRDELRPCSKRSAPLFKCV